MISRRIINAVRSLPAKLFGSAWRQEPGVFQSGKVSFRYHEWRERSLFRGREYRASYETDR